MEEVIRKRNTVTLKQIKAAEVAVDSVVTNKNLTKKEILRQAGYAPSKLGNPHQVFNSEGFKRAVKELSQALMIDKDSRMLRLAQIFWEGDAKDAIRANQELSKMQGDYLPTQTELRDLREERSSIIKPD